MTSSALAAIAVGVLFVSFMTLGLLRDAVRTQLENRRFAGFVDRSRAVDVNAALMVSSLGLSDALTEPVDRHILLFVSDRCTTCFEVMAQVPHFGRSDLTIILNARTADAGREWLTSLGIKPEGPHIVRDDLGYHAALFFGQPISPVMVLVVDDRPYVARTVPSGRMTRVVLDQLEEIGNMERVAQRG